jgi:hypothetical protein
VKQKWLYAILVLSLAVNAGVLGYYGIRKYQDWRRFREYAREWYKPGTTRHQHDRLLAEFDKSRAPTFDTMRTAIKELGLLAIEPDPDSERVNVGLDRIARAKREQFRLLRALMRAHHRLYRPEKIAFWRKWIETELDSVRGAESSGTTMPGGSQ